MPHTPFVEMLRRAVGAAGEASIRRTESERVLEERASAAISRREFVGKASGVALATLTGRSLLAKNGPGTSARVVVVGAGLAGLTCAYRLKQAGISAIIYEATSRVGGRCWTKRGFFKEGQIVERGGELIDSGHTEIQALAAELGLILDDLIKVESLGTEPFYYFDGSPYTFEEATNDFLQIYPQLQKDIEEAGYPTLYNSFTERGFKLDHTSIADYINEIVPGGLRSRFGQLLAVAYTIEYGQIIEKQGS